MANGVTRRGVLKAGAGSLALAGSAVLSGNALCGSSGEIVVIGAGAAGSTAAIALKNRNWRNRVTLIERDPALLLSKSADRLPANGKSVLDYRALQTADVDLAIDEVVGIDWSLRHAVALSGRSFAFDHLVVAPGVAPQTEEIEGYGPLAAHEFPHALAGGRQARRLLAQIETIKDGGTLIIRAPDGAQRYPAGPYERATRIARYYMQEKKLRCKIIIFDNKDDFPGRSEFQTKWATEFPTGMIEWIPASAGGRILAVDVAGRRLKGTGGWIRGDVINFIPAQQAGKVAHAGGLTDQTGWCPVDAGSLRSKLRPTVSILGDANNADNHGKSADAAQRQARLCAKLISHSL